MTWVGVKNVQNLNWSTLIYFVTCDRFATAQGELGMWMFIFPDRRIWQKMFFNGEWTSTRDNFEFLKIYEGCGEITTRVVLVLFQKSTPSIFNFWDWFSCKLRYLSIFWGADLSVVNGLGGQKWSMKSEAKHCLRVSNVKTNIYQELPGQISQIFWIMACGIK